MMFRPNEVKLVCTCEACPEQYDLFVDGAEIGYIRIRHGYITADRYGSEVYSSAIEGDGMLEETERAHHLFEAVKAICA